MRSQVWLFNEKIVQNFTPASILIHVRAPSASWCGYDINLAWIRSPHPFNIKFSGWILECMGTEVVVWFQLCMRPWSRFLHTFIRNAWWWDQIYNLPERFWHTNLREWYVKDALYLGGIIHSFHKGLYVPKNYRVGIVFISCLHIYHMNQNVFTITAKKTVYHEWQGSELWIEVLSYKLIV